jgi:hypothetical protein
MGKVLRNGGRLSLRKDTIYVSEKISGNIWGYAGIVTGKSMNVRGLPTGKPCLFGLSDEDLSFLQEGDVIVLEPTGLLRVVWDADSPHNSIFVTESCNCR